MLLAIGFHALPYLFHNLCSVDGALCLEIITFRIVLVSYDDHLKGHPMSGILVSSCWGGTKTYPKSLRMSPTNFTAYNHAEWHPTGLHTAIEKCLPGLPW